MNQQIASTLLLGILCGSPALGSTDTELSLSDLMDIKVESVSKRSEPLIAAPSAVYVITSEDLKKYGITRLQDALKLVPGVVSLDVNYASSSEFGLREDVSEMPTKIAFQLDGVPLQNLAHGSLLLKGMNLPIDEIDRIEVIRGNGGTVYGANSVLGVISIYTKHPSNGQGLAVSGGGGGPGHADGALRYGSTLPLGQSTHWMLYGGMDYNKGYDLDGSRFSGATVAAPTPTGSVTIENKFTSDQTDKPVNWNAMLSTETKWSPTLKTALRLYASGMEDNTYTKKAYPYLTYTQAMAKVLPSVLPKYVTTPTDLPAAEQLLASGNTKTRSPRTSSIPPMLG